MLKSTRNQPFCAVVVIATLLIGQITPALSREPVPLLDPEIVFSGFYGGAGAEGIADVALDSAGNIYMVGATQSGSVAGFPVAVGPDLTFNPFEGPMGVGNFDAFIAKFSPDGRTLIYAGYIGGMQDQYATGVAVDAQGAAYVVGTTRSRAAGDRFPVVGGGPSGLSRELNLGAQPTNLFDQDQTDAFVAKVSPDGVSLIYSGFLGGFGPDTGTDIAVDAAGNAYICGTTLAGTQFPLTVGPGLAAKSGREAFVVKLSPDASRLIYSGLIPGSGHDSAYGLAINTAGNAFIVGRTSSTDLPVVGGPKLAYGGGTSDAFAARVKVDGSGFDYLGYIGGAGADAAVSVAVDSNNAAYLAGVTMSNEGSFPVVGGPDLTFNGSASAASTDAFVVKVAADGLGLVYAGYIGGAGDESVSDIAIDSGGSAYVTGSTISGESTFPLVGAIDATLGGGTSLGDAFVARIRASGGSVDFATYLGGTDEDTGTGLVLDAQRNIFLVGATLSGDGSFTVSGGFSEVPRGLADGFVAKLVGPPSGPAPPFISSVAKVGKPLVVTGTGFVKGAKILVNGTAYKTKADATNPTTSLNSKKAGKIVKAGDSVKVRNPDGVESNAVIFGG